MDSRSSYRTIGQAGLDEFVEKRSRFIGAARPVVTEQEALAFIAEKKKEHWDATHNVYAYVLRAGGVQRGRPGCRCCRCCSRRG